jgi:cation:H+ antiporter
VRGIPIERGKPLPRHAGDAPHLNGLLIVGLASSIAPITIGIQEVAPALVLGLAALALTYPPATGVIGRWRGILLLGIYAAYLATMLQWGATT